jgi:hypothetical protein
VGPPILLAPWASCDNRKRVLELLFGSAADGNQWITKNPDWSEGTQAPSGAANKRKRRIGRSCTLSWVAIEHTPIPLVAPDITGSIKDTAKPEGFNQDSRSSMTPSKPRLANLSYVTVR